MRLLSIYCYIVSLFIGSAYAQTQAQQAFQNGQFGQAIHSWQTALTTANKLDVRIGLALAYRSLGFYDEACQNLKNAIPIAKSKVHQASLFSEIGDLALTAQQSDCLKEVVLTCKPYDKKNNEQLTSKAQHCLQRAENIARDINDSHLLAQIFNKQGNMLTMLANSKFNLDESLYEEALQKYRDSIEFAANEPLLTAKAKINIAKTTFLQQTSNIIVVKELESALLAIQKLSPSHDKSFGLLALSRIATQLAQSLKSENPPEFSKLQYKAYLILQQARQSAEKTGDKIALSYVYGSLGELYYNATMISEALSLTRQALFTANQADFLPEKMALPELVYRWYWQLGRLFKIQGKSKKAIDMYQLAIENLQPIRQLLVNSGYCGRRQQLTSDDDFQNSLAPLYFELMDLLIKKNDLQELLYTLELFKVAEFQNYDEEFCLETLQEGQFDTRITLEEDQPDTPFEKHINNFIGEKMVPGTAILYPILLPDLPPRLLVSLPNGLFLSRIKTSYEMIEIIKDSFAGQLSGEHKGYQRNAQRFYDLLIQPIEASLEQHNIHTLVVIPDAIMRTIPFAAFHDGEQFLIKKYAVAVTQGLALTKLEKLSRNMEQRVFLGGISEAVQEFRKLPKVPWELDEIEKFYPKPQPKKLLNRDFEKAPFEFEIEKNQYSIVHIASHGVFDENPRENFVLTYKSKITIDDLEKLIKSNAPKIPVELLTLSACQTAEGSDQAALGLAGVAVKTGVKSALGNLWEVDDEAASQLSVEFYRQLRQRQDLNIAQVLQRAQVKRLKNQQHPYFWAPLLLVGNWQ
jgi:CHAT domain-containing protein